MFSAYRSVESLRDFLCHSLIIVVFLKTLVPVKFTGTFVKFHVTIIPLLVCLFSPSVLITKKKFTPQILLFLILQNITLPNLHISLRSLLVRQYKTVK